MSGGDNRPSLGLNLLSFLIPILGFIFFQTYVCTAPAKAASIRIFTIFGLIVWVIVFVAVTYIV